MGAGPGLNPEVVVPEATEPSTEEQIAPSRYRLQRAISSRDVITGMNTRQVRRSWGDPTEIQFAGQSKSGNQRWIYVLGAPTGLNSKSTTKRIVYFESGHVVGWETH